MEKMKAEKQKNKKKSVRIQFFAVHLTTKTLETMYALGVVRRC